MKKPEHILYHDALKIMAKIYRDGTVEYFNEVGFHMKREFLDGKPSRGPLQSMYFLKHEWGFRDVSTALF